METVGDLMSNKCKISILTIVVASLVFLNLSSDVAKANKFEGNEAYWNSVCSGYITDPTLQKDCIAYQNYIQNKINDMKDQASSLNEEIAILENDISSLESISKKYMQEIKTLENNIASVQQELDRMAASIIEIDDKMKIQEQKILDKKEQIKERMIKTKVKISTNQYVDFIMGADNLVDMIKRANNVELFMEADKQLMDELQEEINTLNMQKDEIARLQETQKIQQQSLEVEKEAVAAKKADYDRLAEATRVQVAQLEIQMREANKGADTLEANMPSMSFGPDGSGVPDINSDGFVRPVNGGVTCGMGCYENHVGTDFNAPLGTPIYAPADAVVAYASNSLADNTGFLGNYSGVPSGGGNTIKLIMNVNGVTYSMNFFHLSSNMPAKGKTTVSQGEIIGYSGQTGNSTGPHLHLEMYQLNISLQEAVKVWNYGGYGTYAKDWTHGVGWSLSNNASSFAVRLNAANYF